MAKNDPAAEESAPEDSTPRIFEELGKIMAEGLKARRDPNLESEKVFEERITAEVVRSMGEYRKRFRNGYRVLLEELGVDVPEEED